VRSAIVVGLPDEDLGQRVHALVDAPNGLTQQDLCDFLSEELVRYKIPRSFEFVNHPLRDDAGKARRSQLATTAKTYR
jgi:bile acid-coenzyme A ligase